MAIIKCKLVKYSVLNNLLDSKAIFLGNSTYQLAIVVFVYQLCVQLVEKNDKTLLIFIHEYILHVKRFNLSCWWSK